MQNDFGGFFKEVIFNEDKGKMEIWVYLGQFRSEA